MPEHIRCVRVPKIVKSDIRQMILTNEFFEFIGELRRRAAVSSSDQIAVLVRPGAPMKREKVLIILFGEHDRAEFSVLRCRHHEMIIDVRHRPADLERAF